MDYKRSMDGFLEAIYGSKQTVFTSKEIALLIGEEDRDNLKSKLSYRVKTKKLIRLRRGIFAKNENYNRNELAVRIATPAYVSFETILSREGVTFQHYDTIFVASYLSREIFIGTQKIVFRKLKDEILLNQKGLINRGTYFEATKERAFLDRLYLFPEYFFDNLRGINWEVCIELASIYGNDSLLKIIENYRKEYAQ